MPRRFNYPLIHLIAALLLAIQPLWARVINVPDDNQTIQSAIDAAEEGDTVLVQPGLYEENISFTGRNIVLGSLFLTTGEHAYLNSTVIDGRAAASVLRLLNGESEATVITGFTIRNGRANYGAGVYLNATSPTLDHLVIAGNYAVRDGGGIYCTHAANPVINHITVTADSADRGNGGLHTFDNSAATIVNSIFWGNTPAATSAGQSITYSDIQNGYAGQGNANANPRFVDPGNGDFQLQDNSPCIDVGDPNAPGDPDGTRADMGAFYFNQTPSPHILVSQDSVDFGAVRVGVELARSVLISNLGDADLIVQRPTTDGEPFHADMGEWESDTLQPGDSLETGVFFTPAETGDYVGHLTIISNDADNDTLDVLLLGIGAFPIIGVASDTIDFGEVFTQDRVDRPLVVLNAGLIDLTVSGAGVQGDYFTIDFGGEVILRPDESVQLMVAFSPAAVGEFEGTVVIASDDPENPEIRVSLLGIGGERVIQELGAIDTPEQAWGVAIAGSLVLVADGADGLRIIDISNPDNPTESGNCETPGNARSIAIAESRAYVADGEGGLRMIDFSDPQNPAEIWAIDTPGMAYGVTVVGSYAYVADYNSGLRIVDVSDPDNPNETGACELDGNVSAVTVMGDIAYVANEEIGLRVIDISDKASPHEVGSVDTPGIAYGVAVRGGYAYVADGENGLCIIDISAPDNPEVVTSIDTPGSALNVALAGGFAYVADSTAGITAINITNLENIENVYGCDTPGEAQGVAALGGLCFVADGGNGLRILDISEIAQYPLITVSPDSLDFGVIVTDHSSERTITIANRGNWTLNVAGIVVEGNYFSGGLDDPILIEPGESYDAVVSFTPQDAGDFAGTVTVLSDAPQDPKLEISLSGSGLVFEIIEEQGSLLEFFAGTEGGCAYDNWVSHIVEGIARAGYNEYGPPELDRQTNGFGTFTPIDSLENLEEIIASWREIFDDLVSGNVDAARVVLALSSFSDKYQMVHLEDGEKEYIILREILNDNYFDDNGTGDGADDVRGSFDLGWGLFVFDLDPLTPNVIIEVPHPEDDYLAPYSGVDAFQTIGARAFFVAGVGREVAWTGLGNYTNLKSLSDPTRFESNPFHQAHVAAVELIDQDFVIQIHSYDTDAHPNLAPVELSTRLDYYPNRPVLDFENHIDIVSLTPEVPVPANFTGHENHDSVRVDNYYAVWYDTSWQGVYRYHNRFGISDDVTMFASSWNQQMLYSFARHDTLEDDENWLHIEQDEFPDVITEDILSYYSAGGRVTYRNYAPATKFYHPTYEAIRDYYHHKTLHNVPEDYQTIQSAIDASVNGDTVLVYPGTYVETINFKGKDITLGSLFLTTGESAYIDSTVIDGNRNGSVVRFDSEETNAAWLTGFTIRNGSGSIDAENDVSGGGIHCHNASPRLTYLKVIGNNAWYAAGIYCELGSDAIIDHCLITGNVAAIAGGGMDCYAANPTMSNCTIVGNEAIRGGGLYLYDGCKLTISNTIFWDNAPQEVLYSLTGVPDTVTFDYCDVMGGITRVDAKRNGAVVWGEGNFDLNPLFTDTENGDYSLGEASPCIDAGDPDAGLDPDDTWLDLGTFYAPHERGDQPHILVNALSFDFGSAEIGQSVNVGMQIRNTGYSALTISEMSRSGDNPEDFALEFEQAISIEPGQLQTVMMAFVPGSAGRRNCSVMVASNDPVHSETEAALTGFGLNRQDRHRWVVPDDLESIQDAIDIAADGDTILVRQGEYFENVVFSGKEVVLASFFLMDKNPDWIVGAIIHGDNSGGVVSFIDGESENAELIGFTIIGGQDGIYCAASSPVIKHCVISANAAVNAGGAGIYARGGASPQFINCTIVSNSARWGGGEYIRDGSGSILTNCIVWNNDPNTVYSSGAGAQNQLTVSYSDMQGNRQGIVTNNNCQVTWGNGVTDIDPRFVDLANGDFRLSPDSPCIDAGDANTPLDPDSTRTDMGALFFDSRVPRITVSPDSLNFEPTQLEQTSELGLAIGNNGVADLTIQDVTVEGEYFSAVFEAEFVLSPDSDTTITVTFSPAVRGDFEGVLTVASDDPETPQFIVPLHGIGENTPPEILREIPDLTFNEDTGPWTIADLDTVFSDPEGDELTFSVSAADPLTATIGNEEHILVIESPENFNTEGLEIQVTASDRLGGRRSIVLRTVIGTAVQSDRIQTPRNIRSLKEVNADNSGSVSFQQTASPVFRHATRDGTADDAFTVVISPVNDNPRWVDGGGVVEVNRGDLLEFNIHAVDPDVEFNGDALQLSMINDDGTADRGAEFVDNRDQSGTYSWQTEVADIGVYRPEFEVVDQTGLNDRTIVEIHVVDRNHPPEVVVSIPDQEFREDSSPWIIADLDTVFEDPDGDGLAFSVDAPEPLTATIDNQTHLFSIECPENFNGANIGIDVTADDGHAELRLSLHRELRSTIPGIASGELSTAMRSHKSSPRALRSLEEGAAPIRDVSTTTSFMLTILPVNDAPTWIEHPINRIEAVEGDTISFDLRAADADTNQLALKLYSDNLPESARLTDNGDGTGVFNWITDFESMGSYSAMIYASDGSDSTGFELLIDITNLNRPPELVGRIADVVVDEDCGRADIQDLSVTFRDRDNEALTYAVQGAQAEAGVRIEGSILYLNPQAHYNHPAPVRITVTATDSSQASAQCEFDLTINPVNYPPAAFNLISPVDGYRVNRGEYNVEFAWESSEDVDPEDSLRYSLFFHIIYLQIDTTVRINNLDSRSLTEPLDSLLRDLQIVSSELVRVPITWWVEATDGRLSVRSSDRWQVIVDAPLSISSGELISTEFRLISVHPNPFNSKTMIEYALPSESHVQLSIYNLAGRQTATLASGTFSAGVHSVLWSADQDAAGIYIVRLEAGGRTITRRVLLVK